MLIKTDALTRAKYDNAVDEYMTMKLMRAIAMMMKMLLSRFKMHGRFSIPI
jgi:hypothetical protein